MSAEIEVRQARLTDLDDLALLFDGYRQFYLQPSDVDGARRFLSDRFEHLQSVIFIAFVDGRALGFTQLYPSFSSVSMQRLYILNDLFVHADGRRHGLGRLLLRAAAAFGRTVGAKELQLQTALDNHAAQALYESEGWIREQSFYVYELSLKPK
ncbi:GNAT family N-acetyltransferase [Ahniella affigens]|uniref:GNAT family N-acetyltransferase n=1 Tax=Ahniella affigens TaxID=2021234 RepID=A0A2P1PX71_9GAMM|nr:GNAT family N-acetyltransferase [Ahniella affigens]AVP99448.1 GNAT family N-acetyltransferase [Ahniella affigens]